MRSTGVLLLAGCLALPGASALGQEGASLGVMSFNVWTAEGSSSGRAGIVAAVQAGGADIVGFQEMGGGSGATVANALGMSYDAGSQIATRYRILDNSYSHGVRVELAPGHEAYVFNVHLQHYFYGPYQLAGIEYVGGPLYDPNDPADIDAVVQDQVDSRGDAIASVLEEMQDALASGLPVFLTGDFNEASHLDWTAAAAAAGVHSAEVPWPTSIAVQDAGLSDSFRVAHPDEVANPGNTWSPVYGPDYQNQGVDEPQDRIDIVYYAGQSVTPTASQTVGPSDGLSDLGVDGYPSDHRGVASHFDLGTLNHTTLTFTALGGNGSPIAQTYADHALSTPNLALSYTSTGGVWSFWAEGNWGDGAAFLDSGNGSPATGATYDLAISADAGYAAVIESFDLLDWASNDTTGHSVDWALLDASGAVVTSGTAQVGDDEALHVETGLAGPVAGGITLRLTHTAGENNDLGLDNVRFDQARIGDLSGDGFVGVEDLDILLANWGDSVDHYDWASGDLTGDGMVGQADLDAVLNHWSHGEAPDVQLPEPGTLGLLGVGLAIGLCRQR
ncbi:MAG: endonuclease/exonuclease/phosphatase family protein [Phycisphaerales bacterium JB063]